MATSEGNSQKKKIKENNFNFIILSGRDISYLIPKRKSVLVGVPK
jgi:hypothetical protein